MLSRSNVLLFFVLGVQLVLLVLSVLTSAGGQARPVEPILAALNAAAIDRLHFTDDLGNEVTIARRAEGWALPGADDFPVDGDKVDEILAKLRNMDTRRLVATIPANFVRLEVAEEEFRRKVTLSSEDASAVLYLGGSGGADSVYARRAGEDNVYLGLGLNSWELSTQVSTWIESSYVNVPPADVLEITVQNSAGRFNFLRQGDGMIYADLGEGEAFEDTKMPIILRNAATIRMLAPLGLAALDDYQLDQPRVTVEVRYRIPVPLDDPVEADAGAEASTGEASAAEVEYREETYRLSFGAELEDGVVLKSSKAEYYVLARETVFEAFSDLSRADLVKTPAESQAPPP